MGNLERGSKYEPAISVALVTLIGLLSYAILLPQLGFYRDDWYLVWTAHSMGPRGLFSLFQGDRPFVGWLYILDYRLLGLAPMGWHIFALLLRLAGAIAFLWLLRRLWPDKRLETTSMALLFVVYPGFFQQPNATTFNMLLLAYTAAMLSIAFTLQAAKSANRSARYGFVVAALSCGALYLYIYEALIGLEVARLILLWYFLHEEKPKTLKQELQRLLGFAWPFLVLAAGFLVWRLFIFDSTRRATSLDVLVSGYEAVPIHGLLFIVVESIKDWVETTFFAWSVPLYQFMSSFRYRDVIIAFGLAIFGSALLLIYRRLISADPIEASPDSDHTACDWIWLGGLIIIITTAPIILAGRNVIFAVQWDRYTFQSLIGVALFLGGLIFAFMRGNSRIVMIIALVSIGIMTQYFSAAYYRDFWTAERNLWWQLSWRAPSIEPGSTVIASLPSAYQFAEEYEVWGPLNLIFSPSESTVALTGQVPFSGISLELERGTKESRMVRGTIRVNRDYGKALLASMPSTSSCLHLVDGAEPNLSLSEPDRITLIAHFSQIDLIDTQAPSTAPLSTVFGSEPAHEWCYFYQKIGLALQKADWREAARLADASLTQGFRPTDQSEWLVIIEAYLRTDRPKDAKQASKLITDQFTRSYLCQQLRTSESIDINNSSQRIRDLLCGRGD